MDAQRVDQQKWRSDSLKQNEKLLYGRDGHISIEAHQLCYFLLATNLLQLLFNMCFCHQVVWCYFLLASSEEWPEPPRVVEVSSVLEAQATVSISALRVVSSSWDKLTPVTEEGTKLVCSSLFFLAFYKNRHKNRNGNEKAIHLRVERPCMSRRVSACLRPKTKRGEKLLLWDDQGLPIGHPGLALSEREPGKPAEPDNVIIRAGLQRNKPYLVWSRTR